MHATATATDLVADIDALSYEELVDYRDQLSAVLDELKMKKLALIAVMVDRNGRPATRELLRAESQWSETEIQRALRDARALSRRKR